MKYQFIAEHQQAYPVKTTCWVLEVAVSGYYAWLRRLGAPSRRSQANAGLGERIVRIYQANRGCLRQSAHSRGAASAIREHCGRKRVARLMREQGLSAKPRTHRVRTTDSQHEHPVAPNLLNRDGTRECAQYPRGWLISLGCGHGRAGSRLSVVLDIFSRMVVGWAMDSHRDEALVEQAALMALARRHRCRLG